MRTLLWVVVILDCIFILLIAGVRLKKYATSKYALLTELQNSDPRYIVLRKRLHSNLGHVMALQKVELIIAGVVLVSLLTYLNGVGKGILYSLAALLAIAVTARLAFVVERAGKLFESTLDIILKTTTALRPLWVLLGIKNSSQFSVPHSEEEFADMITTLPSHALTSEQKERIISALQSYSKKVSSIMTHKNKIVTVKPSAVLGPILLSDLQKSSHGYFPVMVKNGVPEGILQLSHLTDMQQMKTRKTVADVMQPNIVWAEEDMSVGELIQLFLQEKQYIICVRNLSGDFIGVVTIADIMKHSLAIEKE